MVDILIILFSIGWSVLTIRKGLQLLREEQGLRAQVHIAVGITLLSLALAYAFFLLTKGTA